MPLSRLDIKDISSVVIGLSSPLVYCAIFSIMSSDVVDLHICICMRVFVHAAKPCSPPSLPSWPGFPACWFTCSVYWPVTRSLMTAAVVQTWECFTTFSRQTLLSEAWQFCESLRDAELKDHAVWAVRVHLETRCESGSEPLVLVRWFKLLCFFATLWHWREPSDERHTDHFQFKYWLLRRLMPGITDRSLPVLWHHQFVSSLSSTKPLPRCIC